jgi:hypothetical protein
MTFMFRIVLFVPRFPLSSSLDMSLFTFATISRFSVNGLMISMTPNSPAVYRWLHSLLFTKLLQLHGSVGT